jgi:sugar phosphate isomerase/epimerase
MKIGFSRPTLNNDERQVLFTTFGSYGYNGLQLKYQQYSEYIENPALFSETWGEHTPNIASGLIAGSRLDTAGIAQLRALFAFGQRVGSERIIFCHAEPRQRLSTSAIKGFARTLTELGKEAQQYGISFSLHHHYNQPVMYRNDFSLFFDTADEQFVKLTLDTAHLVKSGIEDIAGIIYEYRSVIDNVHVKDFAAGEFQVLGRGNIDFTSIFAALHDITYNGWLCADEESGSGLLDGMRTCAQFLLPQRA